jgi:hypothetical protein
VLCSVRSGPGGRASGNQIGDAGAADLAKALASGQCGLTELWLSSEPSPYVGEASVLCSVRSGPGGRASGNKIGDAGAADLAKALASGQCGLTSLDLDGESAPR